MLFAACGADATQGESPPSTINPVEHIAPGEGTAAAIEGGKIRLVNGCFQAGPNLLVLPEGAVYLPDTGHLEFAQGDESFSLQVDVDELPNVGGDLKSIGSVSDRIVDADRDEYRRCRENYDYAIYIN